MSSFDIVSTVTATEDFVTVVFKTIKLVKSVIDQIQDAPIQIKQRVGRLESLDSLAKQILNTKILQTEDINRILTRCESRVQSLHDLIQNTSFESHDSIKKKAWGAIFSLKEEENILKLYEMLDQEYTSLNTHINLRILAMAENIQIGYNSIDTKLNTIAQATNSIPDSLKCLQALFITDPETDRAKLINSKGELVQGTCDWIAQKEEFVEWKASDGGLLWISGGPGLGKTMLSIYLISYLSSCFLSTDDGKIHYSTYFFCDANDNTRYNAIAIIRGILFQLVQQKKELLKHILPSYQVKNEQLFKNSFETVWKFFVDMINDLGESQTTCVLDGLDECEPTSLELLLKNLEKITKTFSKLKMIILSREYPRCIGVSLGRFPNIRLDPDAKTEVNHGLEQYISTRVTELSESKQYPTQLANHVKNCLMEKSAGTYLWVSFTVKDLQTMEISEVEASLSQLPQGLDALYERILQQVEKQVESAKRGLISDILRWCTFAVRPLSLKELAAALEIKPTGQLDSITILRGKLAYCGHLLSITDDTVTLVHHSAYDFLTRRIPSYGAMPWFSLSNVELEQSKLASSCISYFYDVYGRDKDAFQYEVFPDEERKLPYPFFNYATRQWTEHFRHSGERGDNIITEHPKFFSDKSEILYLWIGLVDAVPSANMDTKKTLFGEPLRGQTEIAVHYGLPVLLKRVLKKEGSWRYLKDLFSKGPGRPHLQIAAENGHVPIIEMLLKNKASVNSKLEDYFGRTALYCAADYGHLLAVKILVENGADIDDGGLIMGRTALDAAVERGHYEIVQYLLTCGANVNGYIRATTATSPLGIAFSKNRPDLVKLLLEWGADDRLRTVDFEVHFAPMLSVFLEHWSKRYSTAPSKFRDKVDFGGTTALHIACKRGDLPAIQMLLDPKWSLDLNHQDQNGNTPLHWAAAEGELQAVMLLLMKPDVDPKLLNHRGLNPFHLALFRHRLEIVEYLYMIRNWNISPPESNEKCGWDGIHLTLICRIWFTRVQKMLQLLVAEYGVDPEIRTPKAKRPDYEWHSHHFSIGDGLLSDNAGLTESIDPEDFCYETPLSLAIRRGSLVAVDYFLANCNSIDPDAPCRGCDGATPLHVAAQSLRYEIVHRLTSDRKVNANSLDNFQRTPLHSVASGWVSSTYTEVHQFAARNKIIQLLVEAGAQTSAMDTNGCTPRDLFVSNKSFEDGGGNTDRGDEFDSIIRSCSQVNSPSGGI